MKLKLKLLLLCVSVVFVATSCNHNYKDLIVGGWQEEPGSITSLSFLFYPDGTFEAYMCGITKAKGTYFIKGSKVYLESKVFKYDSDKMSWNWEEDTDYGYFKIKKLTETKLIFSNNDETFHYKKVN